jgi:hypothetical protein
MLPCFVKKAAVLLSQSDNYFTITPSAKVVDIEIIWLIFMALDVQAVSLRALELRILAPWHSTSAENFLEHQKMDILSYMLL